MKLADSQQAITQQLLLGALREQDASIAAAEQTRRATHLARTSRRLSATLDQNATYDAVLRATLPGRKAWCILETVEADASLRRFTAVHPDPDKRDLTASLARTWAAPDWTRRAAGKRGDSTIIGRSARPAMESAIRDTESLATLERIGFGSLLVIPLTIRGQPQGTLLFVAGEGEPPFTPDEVALAVEIAALSAIALDNARLYAEAIALRRAADAANIAKSAFLANMSHELRTPLNAIGGFAELMELGLNGPVTEEQLASLARIKVNQNHLLTIINEILDYARIDGGHAEIRQEKIPLRKIVADVSSMLIGVAAAKDLAIVSVESSGDVIAWGDPDRVRQIVVNVLMNAIKYSGAGSGAITMTTSLDNGMAVLCVVDHGPGIPPEMIEPIFQPFVQMTSGFADRSGGVGLGLAISRELATAMGGRLTAASTMGAGSSFTLSLPLAP